MLHWISEQHRGAEVGYTLHPEHWGHGYITEATRALGFREVELHRIAGKLDARNTASHRVLTRSGMRTEAGQGRVDVRDRLRGAAERVGAGSTFGLSPPNGGYPGDHGR